MTKEKLNRLLAIESAWVNADDVEPELRAAQEDIRFLFELLKREIRTW